MAYINRNRIPLALLKGDSAFIRYSSHPDGTDFTEERSEGQNYIGFATGQTAPTDKGGYAWVLIPKGEQGVTPHIGDNGHWFIGDVDTGIRAAVLADGAPVVQSTGDSETAVMSQKAVTEELDDAKRYTPINITIGENVGWYISRNGNWIENADMVVSNPIPVVEGMKLRYKYTHYNAYISNIVFAVESTEYTTRPTSNFQIARYALDNSGVFNVVVPPLAKYVFVCYQAGRESLDTISLDIDVSASLCDLYNRNFMVSDLNLPSKLYAVVGEELNVYFDNIVKTTDEYNINVECDIGQQLDRCYRVTPETVGNYPITITFSKMGFVASKTSTIYVTDANTENEKNIKVLVIGDSTTNGGLAVHKLMDNATDKRVSVTALGTRGDGVYKHEGRSGWTANYYVNLETDGTYTNPFYNPSTQTFDFGYYLAQNNIETPDMVILNLGINDVFGCKDDVALREAIDDFIGYYGSMINSIRSAAPNVKIGCCLTIPPNFSQDAFGKSYGCGQTRDVYKHNNYHLVQRIIDLYDKLEDYRVYLLPINTNLDTVYNMYLEDTPVNKRNDATYKSSTGYGCVHPDNSGLWQVADVYWFAINAIF